MRKKIAILGTSPSWHDAPFQHKDWEIWVCNRYGLLHQKPWHRLFEIHQNWDYEDPEACALYLDGLAAVTLPRQVISVVPLKGKANKVIDRDAMFKKYGGIWFSSSFGYMVAHALEQKGVTDIGFWGIELESREEYVVQFSGLRHFIDLARWQGINIHIPERCLLNREPHAYPDRFETALALGLEEKAVHLQKLLRKAEWYAVDARRQADFEAGGVADKHSDDRGRVSKAEFRAREGDAAVNILRGQLLATQHYKRLFVWNTLPPDFGEDTPLDADDSGPI